MNDETRVIGKELITAEQLTDPATIPLTNGDFIVATRFPSTTDVLAEEFAALEQRVEDRRRSDDSPAPK